MKILMMIRELHYSGASKVFFWLAKSLCASGHKVTIFTFGKESPKDYIEGIEYIHKDFSNILFPLRFVYAHKLVKAVNAEISISFLLDGNIYNILACLHSRTKSLVCERNDPYKPHYYKLWILKPLFSFADAAVFQLPKVADYYKNIKKKTAIIPNPVINYSVGTVKCFEDREKKVVSLGRLDIFQKRQDILLKAFALFRETYSDYTLDIYGDGPDYEKLSELTCVLKLQDCVSFKGKTDNPIEAIKNSRIYVLTSDFEGIPNSLMEAMTLGLPCVATDCRPGGASFLIKDGENGFIVQAGDYSAVAEKMSLIASDCTLANRIGDKAKEIISDYREEKIITLWNSYINEITKIENGVNDHH